MNSQVSDGWLDGLQALHIRYAFNHGNLEVKEPPLQKTFEISTQGPGLYEFTGDVDKWVASQSLKNGVLTLFCRHTSASLIIQENADPDVCRDLQTFFERLVAEDPNLYRHVSEGPDDMPAHIRSALTQVSLTVPLSNGRLALGTWQGIYLFEHRRQPHHRSVLAHLQVG